VDLRPYAAALMFPDLCFNRGLQLARQADLPGARREIDLCLRFRPNDDEAKLLLGRIEWAAGNKKSAKEIWKQLQTGAAAVIIKEEAGRCLQAVTAKTSGRRNRKTKKRRKRR